MTEKIKIKSNYLRGDIASDLENKLTGSVNSDNHQLIKFHGIYEQDDRDKRQIRADKKLEKAYSFMIRLRIPGGRIPGDKWVNINEVANLHSTGIVKITTRQTVQLHGIIKAKLKPTVQFFDKYGLDSIAACGDVNRNVIATASLKHSSLQDELYDLAVDISKEFLPKTNAYKEVWLDGEKIAEDSEPLYGNVYLPRKFKIALALPPYNDVDVYAHDVGLIAIVGKKAAGATEIKGYNILVGGGMGMTHGNEKTYPRIGSLIGYVPKERILHILENIITVQRDYGNRDDRKQARLKYTIDRLGLDWFVSELEKRTEIKLEKPKKFELTIRGDEFGWAENNLSGNNLSAKGKIWNYGLFIENGRVVGNIKEALNAIAENSLGNFIFTNNQNVIISDISNKEAVAKILAKYELENNESPTRKVAMACVSFNTCPLALAEAQRYMPSLLEKIEVLLLKNKLEKDKIFFRMTGCPNGCARPYLAEVGFVGTSLGKYNMYLGGSATGDRLNQLYKKSCNEKEILLELDDLLLKYSQKRKELESFGDFTIRTKII